jgi:SpoU rRNA methylase family enzyme
MTRCSGGATAAQHGIDAQHELAHTEGLDDVVVGAELEAHDAVDLLRPWRVTMMMGTW